MVNHILVQLVMIQLLNPYIFRHKTVKCLTSVKGLQGKKDPYLEVEVPDGKYSLYDFFLSLDDENIKQTVNNSREWFNKDYHMSH